MSRLDDILATPNLLSCIESVEHVRVGREVSDHEAVVMHIDWSHTNYGKGVLCCGSNTHKYPIYKKRVRFAFSKALVDYIDDEAIATSLRQLIGQIEDSERTREEYLTLNANNFKFPSLLDENSAHIDAHLQNLYYRTHFSSE